MYINYIIHIKNTNILVAMSSTRLYSYPRYRKSVISISRLTKHINIYKTSVILLSYSCNDQDQLILYGQYKLGHEKDNKLIHQDY